MVKDPPANARDERGIEFHPWLGKIPWRRKWQPIPVFLPGESHAQRILVGCSSLSLKELNMTEATQHADFPSRLIPFTHASSDTSSVFPYKIFLSHLILSNLLYLRFPFQYLQGYNSSCFWCLLPGTCVCSSDMCRLPGWKDWCLYSSRLN